MTDLTSASGFLRIPSLSAPSHTWFCSWQGRQQYAAPVLSTQLTHKGLRTTRSGPCQKDEYNCRHFRIHTYRKTQTITTVTTDRHGFTAKNREPGGSALPLCMPRCWLFPAYWIRIFSGLPLEETDFEDSSSGMTNLKKVLAFRTYFWVKGT